MGGIIRKVRMTMNKNEADSAEIADFLMSLQSTIFNVQFSFHTALFTEELYRDKKP